MSRGGCSKTRDEPERRCIVTGERGDKAGLIRFVLGPEDRIYPDLAGKLPGRGIWVTADHEVLDKAVKKKAFARAARQAVNVPRDLVEQVEAGLTQRLVGTLSLARKAGLAVAGYEKTKSFLVSGQAIALLQASDGSVRGKTKLRPPEGPNGLIEVLTAAELGLAFGRESVIHGALAAGGLTTRVVEEAARLQGMRRKHGGDRPARKDTTTT
ncbi:MULTISPECIES: RNA-binding protein [unclassified Meridianimarinicoccus]|uniref:RNA-binding protein n=1 Tax=unclassified Meridianimarinicoccus TaxID=2923344 RepID=UPI001865F137|nr:RNA-binding protein [Fluviibacterium sp. MJW13]